jgi:hypothetical protein
VGRGKLFSNDDVYICGEARRECSLLIPNPTASADMQIDD